MKRITPYLWFKNRDAEEAMNFYVSVFKNSRIVDISRYPTDMQLGPHPDMGGLVLNGVFELDGQAFYCIDGGPEFAFNEAISMSVACKDQAEIDYYWEKLSAVPESEVCGWCKDKYGLSWQIVPADMGTLLSTPAAMQKMLTMKKIVIAELEAAGKK
jgi:predicted 3-demethylubiquinone-9 3-methyltransferase (glyoxalase superfamily)